MSRSYERRVTYRGKGAGDEGRIVSAAKRVKGDLFKSSIEVGLEELHLFPHGLRSGIHSGTGRQIGGLVGSYWQMTTSPGRYGLNEK